MLGLLLAGRSGRTAPGRRRKLLWIRLAVIVALLVAVFLLHLSGTDLVIIRVVRIVLLVGVIVVFRALGRRRAGEGVSESPEAQ